jgi:non-reducing end alpha-L-arabinofuranosidase
MKKKNRFVVILTLALVIPVTLMVLVAMSRADRSAAPARPEGPCDIYAAAGTPCVTAHSTTRALFASYTGPLYQVIRQSDGKTLDIGLAKPSEGDQGGLADAAAQDVFCSGTICWITKIYDQSGKGNHLVQAPPGTFRGPAKGGFDNLPIADMAPVTINGHKAYGVYIIPGMGLRANNAKDLAINDEPEGIYYVVDGKHYDSGCCFDYGNSSTNSRAVGTGTMETTYYGTATAWGSGNGTGPWIMADMEAGLFSGYNAKKNDVPTLDSWRFVSAFVDGGGGNKWDLRGGDAQKGRLTTFYSGVRPGSKTNNTYFPMNRKGAVLLGNGGDNGNGSSGTFYEGVMTIGYPSEATTDAVQANIVAAKYNVPQISMSRITSFTPKAEKDITVTLTNTALTPAKSASITVSAPKGWTATVSGSSGTTKKFSDPVAPGASVNATFKITSPAIAEAGFLVGKAEWTNSATGKVESESTTQRIRNASPVKINEVGFTAGSNSTNQFIELYNASSSEVDISNWSLTGMQAEWAPVKLGTIPAGTKLAPKGFYVLGLATSGLIAPANAGDNVINVRSITGLEAGQQISLNGESFTITNIGTAASPATTLFVQVSTGPWLSFPAGTTTLPVTDATGFTAGQKIGIDLGGNYEVATVTSVGKAATQTTLSVAAKAGDNTIKVVANSNMTPGDTLIIDTGARIEFSVVKRLVNVIAAPVGRGFGPGGPAQEPGEVELAAPLKLNHMLAVDVSDKGTGISFSPATRFSHKSGDAVQALGSGITLQNKLSKKHDTGAPVINTNVTTAGYQGTLKPGQWYGYPLSAAAGSLALSDASGQVIVDALVYGSQQSNSSANGYVTSPELATLEGDQSQGGCIAVVPAQGRAFPQQGQSASQPARSLGRFPDGSDNDSNCNDFLIQNAITLAASSQAGTNNIKVSGVADFLPGQNIIIGTGATSETAVIAGVGTAGATAAGASTNAGAIIIPVSGVGNIITGQTIIIDNGSNSETATVAAVTSGRRRFGAPTGGPTDTITVTTPLKFSHASGVQVAGTGITLNAPLKNAHDNGTPVAANIPTPGMPNQFAKKQ